MILQSTQVEGTEQKLSPSTVTNKFAKVDFQACYGMFNNTMAFIKFLPEIHQSINEQINKHFITTLGKSVKNKGNLD